MDHFVGKLIEKNTLSTAKVLEVAAHTGAYLIRSRHLQNQGITNEEIEGVLVSLVNFITSGFAEQFSERDFIELRNNTLELLKSPNFDSEIQSYFSQFYA